MRTAKGEDVYVDKGLLLNQTQKTNSQNDDLEAGKLILQKIQSNIKKGVSLSHSKRQSVDSQGFEEMVRSEGDYGNVGQTPNSKLRSIINTNISNKKLYKLSKSELQRQEQMEKKMGETHEELK